MAMAGDDGHDRADREHGREAERPTEIPAPGWKDVLARTKAELKADNASLLAAGVAFFALLALVPALVALVSAYGLIADPADIQRNVGDLLGAAPVEVRNLVQSQLRSIVSRSSSQNQLVAIIGTVVAIWSASSGVQHAIQGVNAAYDEPEKRGAIKLRALSLLLTVGAVLFVMFAFVVVAILPAALAKSSVPSAVRVGLGLLRWPVLAITLVVALEVFYRYAPSRDEPRWSWASPGAIAATVLWLLGSVGFSIYTSNFGKYNETYGSLGAIVVVMLWLYLTAFVVVAGAELNAELERQTRRDTTVGRDEPMGEREAYAADTVGETADEVREERRQQRR